MQDFFAQLWNQLLESVGSNLPNLALALGILIGGWLVALVLGALARGLLTRTGLGTRIAVLMGNEEDDAPDVAQIAGRGIFWIAMLVVLVGFFQALQLTAVTEPLNALLNQIFGYAPQILGAAALILAAWIIASIVRFAITRVLRLTKLDDRLADQAGLDTGQMVLSETLGSVAYYFILLLFLPTVLGALGLNGLLSPIESMVAEILVFLPNILGAVAIGIAGYFFASLARRIATNLLAAAGADRLGERVGLNDLGGQSLSKLVGTVVYALVLIPAVIAALNALQIEAISGPATEMLSTILIAIPAIFGAAIVLGVAFFVGQLISGLVTNILTGIGFNKVPVWLGIGDEPQGDERTPSQIAGYLVLVVIMLFSAAEAATLLNFTVLADLIAQFIGYAAQFAIAGLVLAIGLYFANIVEKVVHTASGSELFGRVIRIVLIGFAAALAIGQTGIAADIVNLAFGLIVGAIAVAFALAFGLGSRDIAAREIEVLLKSVRSNQSKKQSEDQVAASAD
jgi:hypothetical protein